MQAEGSLPHTKQPATCQINPLHAPILFLKILFSSTPNFACPLLIYHQSFQENFRILPTPAHGRFLPDPFRVIAPFHVECCWVTGICREVTHTKAFGGVQLWLKSFWSWARYRCEWSASSPGHFIPGKHPRFFLYRWLGGSQSRSAHFGTERYLLSGFEPRSTHHYYSVIPLPIMHLQYCWLCA